MRNKTHAAVKRIIYHCFGHTICFCFMFLPSVFNSVLKLHVFFLADYLHHPPHVIILETILELNAAKKRDANSGPNFVFLEKT